MSARTSFKSRDLKKHEGHDLTFGIGFFLLNVENFPA